MAVCRGSFDGYAKQKNEPMCDPWDSQGNEKNAISISIAFSISIRNENITSEECEKKPFEIILHVGRVTSFQSWVAKKSCHGQTLINEFSVSGYLSNL